MKVYVTKYALDGGIYLVKAAFNNAAHTTIVYRTNEGWDDGYASKPDWCETEEAALADAERRRAAKIASLKKQIAKLEKMTFPIRDVVATVEEV